MYKIVFLLWLQHIMTGPSPTTTRKTSSHESDETEMSEETSKRGHRVRALLSALSFEKALSFRHKVRGRRREEEEEEDGDEEDLHNSIHVHAANMMHGILDPEGGVEAVFYDAEQFGDRDENSFQVDFRRDSVVLSCIKHQGDLHESIEMQSQTFDLDHVPQPLLKVNSKRLPMPPPPPDELPLRFLRAGKGDPKEGLRRYESTLAWRKAEKMDNILREASPHFDLIKRHYPHFCHGKGKLGEPCYYEQPPKTDLKALRAGGVNFESLLRHYLFVTEFQWQFLERDDLQRSIYIIDLEGIRLGDFVGEVVDFVKTASALSAQHYPERAGYVFVINVPAWFKIIWAVVRPLVDESTLEKIYILRGAEEIRKNMEERIDIENIPQDYGGLGVPLGESVEEKTLKELVDHNNAIAEGKTPCSGPGGNPPCKFCSWRPARSY